MHPFNFNLLISLRSVQFIRDISPVCMDTIRIIKFFESFTTYCRINIILRFVGRQHNSKYITNNLFHFLFNNFWSLIGFVLLVNGCLKVFSSPLVNSWSIIIKWKLNWRLRQNGWGELCLDSIFYLFSFEKLKEIQDD